MTQLKAVTTLQLLVSDPVAPAPVRDAVAYALKLVHRGSKAIEQVAVIAHFSREIEPVRAEGQRSQILPGQVRFEPMAHLAPGETVTLRIVAVAESAGMHRFRAEVKTSDAEIKLVQEETTEFMEDIRRTAGFGNAATLR